jgi:hypothetical protein
LLYASNFDLPAFEQGYTSNYGDTYLIVLGPAPQERRSREHAARN